MLWLKFMRPKGLFRVVLGLCLAATALAWGLDARAAGNSSSRGHSVDWNDDAISWQSFEDGVGIAKRTGRPVMLVFYTTWCPRCQSLSSTFENARVLELSKKFVMIRVDRDKERALAERFAVDGDYIPRMFFLTSEGVLRKDIQSGRKDYRYFFSSTATDVLGAAMNRALTTPGPSASDSDASLWRQFVRGG